MNQLSQPTQVEYKIFISHDTRDKDLAKAFSSLLRGATAGRITAFRSSDDSNTEGIEFGKEWYPDIMEKLNASFEVVCLLTPVSHQRPWLLYEAGVARSKGRVNGLIIGMDINEITGPFANFHLTQCNEDQILKMINSFIAKVPNLSPRESTVRNEIKEFLSTVKRIMNKYITKSHVQEIDYYEEIHHVSIPVRDLDVSLNFYRELLNLREIKREKFPFKGAWFGFPNGQHLHLVLKPEATYRKERIIIPADKIIDVHFALRVNIENWKRILGIVGNNGFLKDGSADLQPFEEFNDLLQLYVLDPDNHVIEITSLTDEQRKIEYLKPSKSKNAILKR